MASSTSKNGIFYLLLVTCFSHVISGGIELGGTGGRFWWWKYVYSVSDVALYIICVSCSCVALILFLCVLDVITHFLVSAQICFMRSDACSPVLMASLVLESEFWRLFGLESVTVIWLKLSWLHNVLL